MHSIHHFSDEIQRRQWRGSSFHFNVLSTHEKRYLFYSHNETGGHTFALRFILFSRFCRFFRCCSSPFICFSFVFTTKTDAMNLIAEMERHGHAHSFPQLKTFLRFCIIARRILCINSLICCLWFVRREFAHFMNRVGAEYVAAALANDRTKLKKWMANQESFTNNIEWK